MNGSYYDNSMDALRLAGGAKAADINKMDISELKERLRVSEHLANGYTKLIEQSKKKLAKAPKDSLKAEKALSDLSNYSRVYDNEMGRIYQYRAKILEIQNPPPPVAKKSEMEQYLEGLANIAANDPKIRAPFLRKIARKRAANADLVRLQGEAKKKAFLRKMTKEELEYLEREAKYKSGKMFKRDVEYDIEEIDEENSKLKEQIKALKERAAARAAKNLAPPISEVLAEIIAQPKEPSAAAKRRAAKIKLMRDAIKLEKPNQTSGYYDYLLSHQLRPKAEMTKAGKKYYSKIGRRACRAAISDPQYRDRVCDKIKTAAVKRAYAAANKKLAAAGLNPIY